MSELPTRALAAALAAAVITSALPASVLAKPGPDHGHPAPGHRWGKGERFDARQAPNYQVVDYRRYHRLRPPPRGYHWVRSGNDAVLVALGTGIVASVIANGMMN